MKTEEFSSKKMIILSPSNSSSTEFRELSSKVDNSLTKIKSKIIFNDFEVNIYQNQKNKNNKKKKKQLIINYLLFYIIKI